jgi:hypothetical protein
MRDQIARLFQHLVRIETDELKVGLQQVTVGVRERRQEAVARTVR